MAGPDSGEMYERDRVRPLLSQLNLQHQQASGTYGDVGGWTSEEGAVVKMGAALTTTLRNHTKH
jgi:hypothetical protein